jgi:EF hand
MKFAIAGLAAVMGLALMAGSYADTRNSKDKATMEQKASPAAPKSDEERAEASQGQPNVPHDTYKYKSSKASASAGSTVPAGDAEREQAFKNLDIDGDGAISKAEASGNAQLMTGFDRADKDRDGKLSRTEYESIGKPEAKAAKTPEKAKVQAKTKTPSEPR